MNFFLAAANKPEYNILQYDTARGIIGEENYGFRILLLLYPRKNGPGSP